MIDPERLPLPRMTEEERSRSRLKEVTDEEWRDMARHYYALVAHVDDCVGRILECLERTGRAEETLVIFTSDHGEYLGDHCRTGKGMPGHDCIVRVPFVLRFPGGVGPGRVVRDMTEHVDVVPTLLDYAGVQTPSFVQGRPLRAALEGADPSPREDVLVESFVSPGMGSLPKARESAVKTREFMYYCSSEGREMLCDRTADPDESTDVSGQPGYAAALSDMRRRMAVRLMQAAANTRTREAEY
jgi:arylsulfatase A-like enzyme